MNHFLMKIKQSDTSNYESAVVALLHPLKMQFRKKKIHINQMIDHGLESI